MKPSIELIDTHAHLYVNQFQYDQSKMLERATWQGVQKIYLPNIDTASIPSMLELEKSHPEECVAMMGLHPCSVKKNFESELQVMEDWLEKRPFCAIGETGIDLHWDTTHFEEQKTAFRRQIQWAKRLNIPIVIHSRKSLEHTIAIIREEKDERLNGIFHCFGETLEQAQEIMELGFYMGIGGVLTYKNSGLDEVLKNVPLDWLVLETDAPYLTPVPHRGKRNESAYLRIIAEKLAEVKNTSLEHVAAITTANAKKVFDK